MCLILEIPPGADALSQEEHDDVAKRNKDGGCVIDTSTGAVIYRGLDMSAMGAALIGRTGVIAHWRMRTSGPIDDDRVHGWQVKGGRLLHNGHIPGSVPEGHSDTSALVVDLIRTRLDVGRPEADGILRRLCGSGVIVIALNGGGVRWVSPPVEVWRGRSYSNRYAWTDEVHGKAKPAPVTYPAQGYYFQGGRGWDDTNPGAQWDRKGHWDSASMKWHWDDGDLIVKGPETPPVERPTVTVSKAQAKRDRAEKKRIERVAKAVVEATLFPDGTEDGGSTAWLITSEIEASHYRYSAEAGCLLRTDDGTSWRARFLGPRTIVVHGTTYERSDFDRLYRRRIAITPAVTPTVVSGGSDGG